MRKLIALFIFMTCCVTFTTAQQQKHEGPEKWDIFAGYSLERAYLTNFENAVPFPMNLNGGQAAVTYHFTRHFGMTGEMTGYHKDTMINFMDSNVKSSTVGYLFGPSVRYRIKGSPISFYAHQLFGVTHVWMSLDNGRPCSSFAMSCTANPFTMVSGGGVDVKLNKHLSVRPVQLEYFDEKISPFTLLGDNSPLPPGFDVSLYGFRYSAGADYRF